MKFLKVFREKYMTSNVSLMVFSIIIAVIAWLYISMTQYPTVQKTVENIPLSIDISGSAAGQNGLSVVDCNVKNVKVELLSSRTEVGYLSNETLEAYFDADSVSTAGKKNLSIKIRSENGVKYEVKSITPSSASVEFDKIESREYPVTPLAPNVSLVDGKEINPDEFVCDPAVVRITGPSAKLDKIDKISAVTNSELSLSSTYVINADELVLFTDTGAEIDQSSLKFSDSSFSITIPVRTQKTVSLTVSIVNAPNNFDVDSVKLKLSADKVTLACNNSQTEIPDELDLGLIALNEIKPGFSKTLSLSKRLADSEFINVSNLETVTVTLDDEGLDQKNLTLDQSRISISNVPDSSYEYSVLTQAMDIMVVGPKDTISEITADDIIADVNLLNMNINTDQFNSNVVFSCPSYDNVWVTTVSKVSVQRTKVEPASTATN